MKCFKYFLTFLLVLVAATAQPTNTTSDNKGHCCKEGYWYSDAAGKCYMLHTYRAVWTDALKACLEEGAVLAVLRDHREQEAIIELFSQQGEYARRPYEKETAFVGIVKRVSGEFYTIYNQRLNDGFAPWGQGEPNNFGGREDCVSVTADGHYYDDPCDDRLVYICEHNKLCKN